MWRNVHDWNMSFDVEESAIEMEAPASDIWKPFNDIQLPYPSCIPPNLRKYYTGVDEELSRFEAVYKNEGNPESRAARESRDLITAARYVRVTLVINLILFIGKIGASFLSASVATFASTVDSGMDVLCCVILWVTNSAMSRQPPGRHPHGRAHLEAVSLLLFAAVMAMGGVMILGKALDDVTQHVTNKHLIEPAVGPYPVSILGVTFVLKGILFVVMCQIPTPTAHVLSVDHRNDVLVSSVALIVGILGSHTWVFIDPIGGVLIALYITIVWCIQGYGHISLLMGGSAPANIQRLIIWSTISHPDNFVRGITRLNTSSCGSRYDVEISVLVSLVDMDTNDVIERIRSRLCLLGEVEHVFIAVEYIEEQCENVSRDLTEVDMFDYSKRRSLRFSDENRRVSIDIGEVEGLHLSMRQVSTTDDRQVLVEESESL